jgi:hypothetical protein
MRSAIRRLLAWWSLFRFQLGALVCRVLGRHSHVKAGVVQKRGWRPAALVVCTRCGRAWRGVKP